LVNRHKASDFMDALKQLAQRARIPLPDFGTQSARGVAAVRERFCNVGGRMFEAGKDDVIAGRGDFIPIFVPWFWQPEYRRPKPDGWATTSEEDDLLELYGSSGMTVEHLVWRRAKIENDFAGDVSKFEQEYPNNWQEAFVAEKRDTFISGKSVQWAQNTQLDGSTGPMVVGVDPARYGDDRTAIVVRQGRKVRAARTYEKKSTMEVAGIVMRFIEAQKPDAVFIDVIGIGAGVYDRLEELGYAGDESVKSCVIPVNVAEGAAESEKYVNKRAEIWAAMKQWIEAKPSSLPESDEWLADLTAPGYTYDSAGRLKIESKEAMRKRGEKSPDLGDALALTFAEPVRIRKAQSDYPLEPSALYEEEV
jgi:hypothetical protein